MSTVNKTGVVLMTYGSATTADNVADYFQSIYSGKASSELIADFENRYRLVGRSPLIEITRAQAAKLEAMLPGAHVVRAGMRHGEPSIARAVEECTAAGATSLIGIILSPQFSTVIMRGYETAFTAAAVARGFAPRDTHLVGPWHTESHFIELLATRVRSARAALTPHYHSVPVIFTTHSLPLRVVTEDSGYLEQLAATISAVRSQLDPQLEWYAGYQSAGHTPEAWLKPDLTTLLDHARESGAEAVLIAPIQFLSDHLEVLYDLDIAARAQCEERGIAYHRISLPNTDPLFIEALAALVRGTKAN